MSKVAKAAIGLMLATLVAKSIGFLRELTLASFYGASSTSDAFLVAMNIPTVIFTIVGTSLGTAFIPLYTEVKNKKGDKEALNFTNNVFNIVIFMCVLLSIIGLVFTEQIVDIFAVGFKGETLNQAIYFTRVLILGLIFLGMSYIMTCYLQLKDRLTITGFMPIPFNILIILSIMISVKYNPYILPWGTLIGLSLQFFYLLPFAIKSGYKYRLYINYKDEYLKKMLYLIIPVLIGVGVNQVNTIVDRTIASTLIEGSISALNYATKLNQFFMGIFVVSISAVIYPYFSNLSSNDNIASLKRSIVKSVNIVTIITIPISAMTILLSKPIISILFQRGEFDERATYMTSVALTFYTIGMIGYALRDILGKAFYALKDTKTPMINGVFAMVINIVLNIFFVRFTNMQLAGLALATSISALVTVVLLTLSLRKKVGRFGGKNIISVGIKSLLATVIMSVVLIFVHSSLGNILKVTFISQIINITITAIISIGIYAVTMKLLKNDETDYIIEKIQLGIAKTIKR